MRNASRTFGLLSLAAVAYLLAWPTDVSPVAWQPPKARGLTGAFASNGKLSDFALLAPDAPGPEAIARDARGTLYSGALDGRILALEDGQVRELAQTGGRPLDLRVRADGSVVAAVVSRGIVEVSATGVVRTLVEREGTRPIRFADGLDLAPDGRILFSEATTRFSLEEFELDAFEHGSTGTLFSFDPATRQLKALLRGLSFPNGVAVHPSGRYVLVNETWNYRVLRVWIAGERAGRHEVVIDNLPGFPDNITFDAARGLFWIGLGSPRDAALDALGPYPFLRKMVARLPQLLRPKPKRHAMALAIDERGRVVHFFDDPRSDSYSPTTGVLATEDALYLGSFEHVGIARVALSKLGVR